MTPLAKWLGSIGLEKYEPLFVEHEITLEVLPLLTETDIERLTLPIGPRRLLSVALKALADSPATDVARIPNRGEEVPAAPRGERRQLTVMFCDLVGSTALAEQLDPEELREVMQAYRKACTDVTTRYEGHVAQYLGDGLMIYFGWPCAHEDDAQRAVRAALDMVQSVCAIQATQPLTMRIGLATGPVVVGEWSGNENVEARLAVGETPNLAARLQGVAGPGEVVIALATRRLVGNVFELTNLGSRLLKGIAEPVKVWRVDSLRRTTGRFEAAHVEMELTRLVGREEEIGLLLRRWKQVRDGEGQVVLIAGEAGIGKSHVAQVLRQEITEPHATLCFQCSPYHLNSALHPFIEQFEMAAGFAREDTFEEKLDKMEVALVGTAVQVNRAAPLYAAMLSLPGERYLGPTLSPQKQKERTLEAIVGQVEAMALMAPVLMLFEDVHWIDPTSQEALDALMARLRGLRVLLVATFRLEHVSGWTGQPNVTLLTLSRLSRRQSARLVAEVTAENQLPQEVVSEILARTDGVPLFVEEMTKWLLESGVAAKGGESQRDTLSALPIPASLRDSLVSRLDRLGTVKEIAQVGACIGREFSYELIARVATTGNEELAHGLDRLVEAGLATQRGTPPDATYTFKHALIQDAAYDSLLRSRRSQLHARIAQALEEDFMDRVGTQPELLAHHHTLANNLAAAIPYWQQAGELALRRVALKEAIAHFQKGLGLVEQLPPSDKRDALELAIREPLNAAWTGLRGWAANDVGANADAILRLAKSQRSSEALLLGLWWMWTNTITQGRIADSLPWARRLIEEGRATGEIDLQIFGHAASMVSEFLLGNLVASREQAERVYALYDPGRAARWIHLTGYDVRSFVEVYACQLTWMLGFPDQARRACAETVARARAVGHPFNLAWALTFSAYTFAYRREHHEFRAQIDAADRLAREQGIAFIHEVSVPQAIGMAELLGDHPADAIPLLRSGIERWTNLGGHVRVPLLKSALAQALSLQGDVGAGLALIDECLEQVNRPGWQERVWLAEILRLKGDMLARGGQLSEAEDVLRASGDCAREQGARSWELRSATTLASILLKRGAREAASELLTPIYEWFNEEYETPELAEARRLLEGMSTSRHVSRPRAADG